MSRSYSYSPEIWPALLSLALAAYLGAYAWRRRNIPAAKPFIIASILGGIWTLGVILELSAGEFSTKVFWVKFQEVWQLPLASVITCFVFQYADKGRWLTWPTYLLLSLFPLASILLMATNNVHHLIWTGFLLDRYVIASPGPLYWFFNSYIYLLGLINLAVLVWLATSSPRHRLPVAIIISGQILARIGYTLDKFQVIGPGEAILFTVGVVAAAYAFAFLRFHVIDPVASAREAVRQQMGEGLLVLNSQGRIVDANTMAASILGIPEMCLRQKLLAEVLPVEADVPALLREKRMEQTDLRLGKGDATREYSVNATPLRGTRGEVIGQVLLMADITEKKRAQTEIIKQQNVVATLQERERLARELHDGLGQILGYVNMQVQTALTWLRNGNTEKAVSLLSQVAGASKEAHADVRESILGLRSGSDKNWTFLPTLEKYISRFQANYGMRTELSISEDIGNRTFDPTAEVQLFRVIQEAMTNCRKHSGAEILKIDLKLDGGKACISISDDGNGFDAGRFEHEDHTHFGLVFMRERMEQIGGSLEIVSMPGNGTVMKLVVPVRAVMEE